MLVIPPLVISPGPHHQIRAPHIPPLPKSRLSRPQASVVERPLPLSAHGPRPPMALIRQVQNPQTHHSLFRTEATIRADQRLANLAPRFPLLFVCVRPPRDQRSLHRPNFLYRNPFKRRPTQILDAEPQPPWLNLHLPPPLPRRWSQSSLIQTTTAPFVRSMVPIRRRASLGRVSMGRCCMLRGWRRGGRKGGTVSLPR